MSGYEPLACRLQEVQPRTLSTLAAPLARIIALAALVGVVVVAVGGGGIRTMSQRWEAVADRYDQEKPKIAESARNAPSVKDQARQAQDAASQYAANGAQSADGSGERYGATRI